MKIIPAIDIYNGKCVRLYKGDYNLKTEYSNNPVDVAKRFESEGAKFLHLVDLEGAKSNKIINHKVVREICSKTNLKVDFGGGIKSENDISFAFDLGVNQITVGSLAVKNKEIVMKSLLKYGSEKIILGADFLDNIIKINGWMTQTEIDLFDFISEFYDLGLRYVIATDISKDGVMSGPSYETYTKILKLFPNLKLIASGGISIEDRDNVNKSGNSFANWTWVANSGTTETNTDGNTTVTLQKNTTAGFSIGTFISTSASQTLGHGLGVAPELIALCCIMLVLIRLSSLIWSNIGPTSGIPPKITLIGNLRSKIIPVVS